MSEIDLSEHPIFRELKRIFGDRPQTGDGSKEFTILPLVSEPDALQFFQPCRRAYRWRSFRG